MDRGALDPVRQGAVGHAAWLVAAVLLAYASALPGDFVWLDRGLVEQAQYRVESREDFARLWLLSYDEYLLRHEPPRPTRGGYWRPVMALSLSLDWSVWGARPACFHAENLLWHALVVLGLYALGRRLFASLRSGVMVAFGAALLFAVHPLGVQSVTWISGRNDSLCAAFAIASLLAFLRGAEEPRRGRRSAAWLLASLAAALSAGSKEHGLLLPLLAAALWWTAAGSGGESWRERLRRAPLGGLAALASVSLLVAAHRLVVLGLLGSGESRPTGSPLANLAASAALVWHYAGLVLWPRPPQLSDVWPVATGLGAAEVALVLSVLAVLAVAGWAWLRRWSPAPGLVWFALWLLPASGTLPLRHFRAERYLYPAAWGLLAAVLALGLQRPLPRALERRLGLLLLALALPLALLTADANTDWWSDERLFRRAVERQPDYPEGWSQLALLALGRQDYPAAAQHAERARTFGSRPGYTGFWPRFVTSYAEGLALARLDRNAEALAALERALRFHPRHPGAHLNAGAAALASGAPGRAEEHLRGCLAERPEHFGCRSGLAAVHLQAGRVPQALALLKALARERPDRDNLANLAGALLLLYADPATGGDPESLALLEQGQASAPAAVGIAVAVVHAREGRSDRAEETVRLLLRADPELTAERAAASTPIPTLRPDRLDALTATLRDAGLP